MEQDNDQMPSFTNNVVGIKLSTGETLIALTHDEADGIEGLYTICPKLLDIQYYEDGDTYEILDWLMGSVDLMHFIDELHIVTWYKVNDEIAQEYLDLIRPEITGENIVQEEDFLSDVQDFLSTKSTKH